MNIVAPSVSSRTFFERAVRTINDHRLISSFVAIGTLLRALALVAARPALLFYGDSFSYIQDTMSLIPGKTRPIGYPLFMKILGLPGASLLRVVVVQHVLGIALGIAIYAVCSRLGVSKWLSALAAAPILLDGFQINIEHFIMAETLFDVLVFASLALLVIRKKPSVYACAWSGALISFATITRVVGIVLIGVILAYALVQRFGWRRVVALGMLFAVPTGMYAFWFSTANRPHRFALSAKDGAFLYARVAPFVECPGLKIPAYERQLCDLKPPEDRPDSNYYIWGAGAPHLKNLPVGMDEQTALSDFATRAMTQQSGTFARLILGDLFHYFAIGHHIGPKDFEVNRWQFDTINSDQRRVEHASALTGPPAIPPVVNQGVAQLLGRYQRTFYTWGPILLLSVLLGFAGALGAPSDKRLRWESLLFAVATLAMLLVPLITSMFDYRYSLPALPLAGPSIALGGTVVGRRVQAAIRARSQSPSSAPERARSLTPAP